MTRALIFLALFPLTGCGTTITADTPCGPVTYSSYKDLAAPKAVCRIGADGSSEIEFSADSSSASAVITATGNVISQAVAAAMAVAPK